MYTDAKTGEFIFAAGVTKGARRALHAPPRERASPALIDLALYPAPWRIEIQGGGFADVLDANGRLVCTVQQGNSYRAADLLVSSLNLYAKGVANARQ